MCMAGTTYEQQTKMRDAVARYIARWGFTSYGQIAAWVQGNLDLNHLPSKNTIKRIVESLKKK